MSEDTKTVEGGNAAEVIEKSGEPEPKHTITVLGKPQEHTLEELKELAQRTAGADERFRSADAIKKAAEEDSKQAQHHRAMMETVKIAQTPGPDQAQGLRDLSSKFPEFGISKEDAEVVIENIASKAAADKADPKDTSLGPADPPTFEELPDRVQASVKAQEDSVRQANLTAVRTSLGATLDKDEVLGIILRGKRKDTRTKRLLDFAMTILSQKVAKAGRYTPDAVRAAVEETRAFAKDVGLLDVDPQAPSSALGLGRSPTTPFGSLTKSGEAPAQISPEKALNSADYADNVLARLQYQAQQQGDA